MTTANLANWEQESALAGRVGNGTKHIEPDFRRAGNWGYFAGAAHPPATPLGAYPTAPRGPLRWIIIPAGIGSAPKLFTRPIGGSPANLPLRGAYGSFVGNLPGPGAGTNPTVDADDPFLAALEAAKIDEEPFTAEDRAAADAGWREYERGESSPLEEVRRRLLGDASSGHRSAV